MEQEYFILDVHAHAGDPSVPLRIGEKALSDPAIRKVFEGLMSWQQEVGWDRGMAALNPTPENLLKIMDGSGTDVAILSTLSFAEELGGIELCSPEHLATILPRFEGRFLGYAGFDPRTGTPRT